MQLTSDPAAVEHVIIRPARPEDREMYIAAVDSLSDTSRYQRFFTAKPRLLPGDVRRLMDLDPDRQAVWFAIDTVAGRGVGAARYAMVTPQVAEVALAVADELHGRGLGGAMLDQVVRAAGARGLTALVGETLAENPGAIGLMRSRGFRPGLASRGVIPWRLELTDELPDPTRPED